MRWNTQTYAGWGNVLSVETDVARPERHAALADLITDCDHILPIGSQRSYGDAALATQGRGLKTSRMDRLLDFDPETGVLEVEAGIRLGEILRLFAPRGWKLAVLPGTGMTTVGGAIANDVHGKNHHTEGSFGQHVKSLVLLTADGTARRISAKKDAKLFKATLGGVGQTGLITSAVLQLAPCPSTEMNVSESRIENLSAFIKAFEASTASYQVGWIDALAKGPDMGRGILEEAEFASSAPEPFKPVKTKTIPLTPPGLAVSSPVVRMFNALYLRRVPAEGRVVTRSLTEFFFPLDKIADWNRLYGKKGFYQFQCVLPQDQAADGLSDLLEIVSDSGIASPLAVLKKMGDGRAGYLSFPMAGYTLAIDLPNRSGTEAVLHDLADVSAKFGGRVYLAKDGAISPQAIVSMYPEIEKFREQVRKVDPGAKFISGMAERLNLRGAS